MKLESPAFAEGAPIPKKHSCEGADVSPPLTISGVPAAAHSLALLCEDPDAPGGMWVHWVLFNLPPKTASLPEGLAKTQFVAGAVQGLNDFGRLGYGGPCPPPGKPHRYFFKLYALSAALALEPGAERAAVLAAMKGRALAESALMGSFAR